MSARRTTLFSAVSLTATAAATGWLATTAWRGFTETPGDYLAPLLLLALLVAGVGIGLRQLRVPGTLVLLAQLVVGGIVSASIVAGTLVLTGDGWLRLGNALDGAVESAQRFQAPIPADAPGIEPLLILGGWFCLVLIDTCVGGLRRAPLAGLPLLTIYSIPVSMLGGGVAWWSFSLTAAGFLGMLFLQHREQTSRWGRGIGDPSGDPGPSVSGSGHAVRASAGALGGIALVLAVLVPQFVPTLSLSVFGFGPGAGGGNDIAVDNPMADLQRDLLRGDDVPLLRVRTDHPAPEYLRVATLNRFTNNEWSTGDRDIPEDQRAQGAIPNVDIDPSIPRTRYETAVSVMTDFDSRWLPVPYPVERVSAVGDWRYDTDTFDFLAASEDLDTAALSYQFTEVELDYEAAMLAEAPSWAGKVSRDYIDLPDDFPSFVRGLAQEVTREVPSRYEKAVALQDWFRTEGGFEYSTDRADPGNGTDELVAFLTEGDGGRVGYCEQFAASMAVMARSLNIPARVAVGFLQPDQIGQSTWEYSSYDYHAWPELYFADAGWVKFDPTPGDRVANPPAYTRDRIPNDGPSPEPSQSPDAGGPSQSGPDRELDPGVIPESNGPGAEQGGSAVRLAVGILALLLLVLLLAVTPRLIRLTHTRERMRGPIEPAWAEVRAVALDLGIEWPEHRSPRETRDHLVPHLGAPHTADADLERPVRGAHVAPEAATALDRLVLTLERQRYARPAGADTASDPQVTRDAEAVIASLYAGATRHARRRATWRPVSVLPWRRGGRRRVLAPQLVRHGGIVDHVG